MELKNKIASSEMVDIYKEGDLVYKVFREIAPKSTVLYEALTHARVEETGLQVPRIQEVSVVGGRWTITMEAVEGKTLAQLMKENPDKADEYLDQFVDIQLSIHAKQMPKLTKIKDKLARQINSLELLDDVKKYELLTRLESMPKHTKLCHGNYTPDNVIINDKGVYILDWIAAKQGNASADVARTYLLLCLNSAETADKYLDLFCQKTNTSKKYVQEWMPIVAAAQLTHNHAEEKELLMKWVDVVAYE